MNAFFCYSIGVKLVFLLLSPLKEFNSNLLKQSEGKKIFVLLAVWSNSFSERINFRSNLISGTVIYDILIADDLFLEFVVNRSGAFSVFSSYETLKFLGNSRISTLGCKENVINCLSAYNL